MSATYTYIAFVLVGLVIFAGFGILAYSISRAKPYHLTETEGHIRPNRALNILTLIALAIGLAICAIGMAFTLTDTSTPINIYEVIGFSLFLGGMAWGALASLLALNGALDIRWNSDGITGSASSFLSKRTTIKWDEVLRFKESHNGTVFQIKARDGRKIVWTSQITGHLYARDAVRKHRPDLFQV